MEAATTKFYVAVCQAFICIRKLEQKIILFTTHRYDTIRKADTIIVLVDGRIAEIGTHEELASHTREFWSLFLAQGSQTSSE